MEEIRSAGSESTAGSSSQHITVKRMEELSVRELFEIYRLRVAVFVVEQNCPYQEVDDADLLSLHVCLWEGSELQAYLRVIPAGVVHEEVTIGRVVSAKRRCGLATKLVKAGIEAARQEFGAESIMLGAQTYARGLYEKCGFVQISEEYLEDGIPHIMMRREEAL